MKPQRSVFIALAIALLTGALAGCVGENGDQAVITQAGSSTVYPIAEAWAEAMAAQGIQVTVAGGGSGAGASKLCAGEIDIADMSREMKQSEIENCQANGIEPKSWKVAYDGITVVVPNENDFIDYLTVEELEHIWRKDNPAKTWADVREGWPDTKISLFGPDTDSGTYEYFNEVILDEGAPRSDYTPSADDNVLVQGVANTEGSLAYFGFAYYLENEGKLKAVPIAPEAGAEPVMPDFDTIADGSYEPLSRPVYMVTDGVPEADTPLHAYFEYAFSEGQQIVPEVGYVALDDATLEAQLAELSA